MYPIILLVFLSVAQAQLTLNGTCDFSASTTSANLSSYVGTWYKFARIESTFDTGKCSSLTIIPVIENQVLTGANISNREVVSGKAVYKNGTVTDFNTSNGVATVTYSDGSTYDYLLLATTNKDYMVVYSCKASNATKSVWAWKVSTNTKITEAGRNATDTLVAARSDLADAAWTEVSFTEADCKVNDGINLNASPFILIVLALVKL